MYRWTLILAGSLFALIAACSGGDDSGTEPTSAPSVTPALSAMPLASACTPVRPYAAGDADLTLSSGGIERRYLLHVPAGYDGSAAAPVIFVLHGFGGTPEAMRDLTAMAAGADPFGVITVFPMGTGAAPAWNINDLPVAPDDVAFFADLLDALDATLCIDDTRVYAAGFSNGGGMAQKLACALPERFAAVATVAATYLECAPRVPVIAFHGVDDVSAPYAGGEISAGVTLPPVRTAIIAWAKAVGCDPEPAVVEPAQGIEMAAFVGCPSGESDVVLYTVGGGGHTWPGAAVELPRDTVGETTRLINATELIIHFFLLRTSPRG